MKLIAILVLGVIVFVPNVFLWTNAVRSRHRAPWEDAEQLVDIAVMAAIWTTGAVVVGYLFASLLFRWRESDSFRKQALFFPAIVGILLLLEMYLGPASWLTYLLSKPFPSAHAGMLSGLLATLILSFVTSLGVRAVDRWSSGSMST